MAGGKRCAQCGDREEIMGLLKRVNQVLREHWPVLFAVILSANTVVLSVAFMNIDRRADELAASQNCRNISDQIGGIFDKESAKLFDFVRQIFIAETPEQRALVLEQARQDNDLRSLEDILTDVQRLEEQLADDENCQIMLIPSIGRNEIGFNYFPAEQAVWDQWVRTFSDSHNPLGSQD